jgi:hypothetical protein
MPRKCASNADGLMLLFHKISISHPENQNGSLQYSLHQQNLSRARYKAVQPTQPSNDKGWRLENIRYSTYYFLNKTIGYKWKLDKSTTTCFLLCSRKTGHGPLIQNFSKVKMIRHPFCPILSSRSLALLEFLEELDELKLLQSTCQKVASPLNQPGFQHFSLNY